MSHPLKKGGAENAKTKNFSKAKWVCYQNIRHVLIKKKSEVIQKRYSENNRLISISYHFTSDWYHFYLFLIYIDFTAKYRKNVVYLKAFAFIRSWWRCTFWTTSLMTLNQHKIENYVIIASLKSETICKLINLLISSLPGSALRTHVESPASLAMSTSVLKVLPDKIIKRHSPSILGKPRGVNKHSQSLAW